MVSLTSLTTSLIVAFLVSTSTAAPSQLGHRQVDSSVFDFTLYETPAPNQAQCFNAVDVRHIAPGSLTNGVSACFTENFYTVEINDAHTYGCRSKSPHSFDFEQEKTLEQKLIKHNSQRLRQCQLQLWQYWQLQRCRCLPCFHFRWRFDCHPVEIVAGHLLWPLSFSRAWTGGTSK